MEGDCLLIGVGVNVKTAPPVPDAGPNLGRSSTCVGDYVSLPEDCGEVVKKLGEDIAMSLGLWFDEKLPAEPGDVVKEFAEQVEFGVRIKMREGGWVVPIRIERDGQLLVRVEDTGEEKLLCSDYML
jgi:biotin-(acetyl-CoA carboxylase) ligase